MFEKILTHWKTSAGGAFLILIAALSTVGVVIPGVPTMDIGHALMIGIPLLLASDAQ
jgi:hypothetical protein